MLAPSIMHEEMAVEFLRMLNSSKVERDAFAAPRGNAKTTFLLALVLFCIVFGLKRFLIYITSTAELANVFLGDVKAELEENERLAEDFPEACGRGSVWRENVIVTRNNRRFQALGVGKKIRGRKHRQWRPDFVVIDDIDDDEHVRNKDQREKQNNWLKKAVLKARGVAQKADFIVSGTLLHFDSVLARLLNPKDNPGWRARIYKAVINWADRQDLWQQWEAIYTDWRKPDTERSADAEAFFLRQKEEMLRGAKVLWEEGETYYDLMCQRIDDGPAAFQSEKQNEPLDPSACRFPEEWFCWFEEVEIDGQTWLIPEPRKSGGDAQPLSRPEPGGDKIALADCDIFGACDPSKGRRDRGGDPSAIVTIAAWPARRLPSHGGRYRLFHVLDGDVAWRNPPAIMDRILMLHAERHYYRFGIETIQFQELFAEDVVERSLSDPRARAINVKKLEPNSDKGLRIEALSPYIHNRRLRFSRRVVGEYYNQLRYSGQHPHDDGPDCTELALETAGEIGWVVVGDMPEARDDDMPKRGTAAAALEERLPGLDRGTPGTCSGCAHFKPPAKGEREGRCGHHGFLVAPKERACEDFEEIDVEESA